MHKNKQKKISKYLYELKRNLNRQIRKINLNEQHKVSSCKRNAQQYVNNFTSFINNSNDLSTDEIEILKSGLLNYFDKNNEETLKRIKNVSQTQIKKLINDFHINCKKIYQLVDNSIVKNVKQIQDITPTYKLRNGQPTLCKFISFSKFSGCF
jgi:hypothetical protein